MPTQRVFRRILFGVLAFSAAFTALFARGLPHSERAVDFVLTTSFGLLFAWNAFWGCLMTLGAYRVWRTRTVRASMDSVRSPDPGSRLPSTVVVIPIYNEHAERVFGRIRIMIESLLQTSTEESFTFFVLSDTTDPDTWLREELAWVSLRRERPSAPAVYYRRRSQRFRNKSGNIHDFLERWGTRFQHMIVLDADSIMDGPTMVELVRRMEAAPKLGMLQAPSIPAMRHSAYARLQQFAASAFGPAMFAGLAICFEGSAAFWGHNAILRIRPFMDHCGLPGLPGVPPFGGPILSHDFVEGALMRRSGYEVRLAWDLFAGSYEQPPASLDQSIARDRRWCQGNLQHGRLLLSPAFSLESRAHFGIGIFFYGASVVWALFLLGFAVALPSDSRTALKLTLVSFVLLMVGKGVGTIGLLFDSERSRAHGGRRVVLASAAIEGVVSAMTAPVVMVSHVLSFAAVTFGVSVNWNSTRRGETSTPLRDAARAHGLHTALGIGIVALCSSSPERLLWLSPIWGSLILSIPLAAMLSSPSVGKFLSRNGIFLSVSEVQPPAVIERAMAASHGAGSTMTFAERFTSMVEDPWLNLVHTSLLDATGVARPKLAVESLIQRCLVDGVEALPKSEALSLLAHPWAMRVLHDRSRHRAEKGLNPPLFSAGFFTRGTGQHGRQLP